MTSSIVHFLVASFLLISTTADVYVCMGPSSKKYHMIKNCSGLSNCSTEIEKVSAKYATEELRRTRCAIRSCQ